MDGQRKTGESMKSVFLILAVFLSAIFLLSGCGGQTAERTPSGASGQETESTGNVDEEMTDMENTGSAQEYTPDTRVVDVINDPVFGDHGRLI